MYFTVSRLETPAVRVPSSVAPLSPALSTGCACAGSYATMRLHHGHKVLTADRHHPHTPHSHPCPHRPVVNHYGSERESRNCRLGDGPDLGFRGINKDRTGEAENCPGSRGRKPGFSRTGIGGRDTHYVLPPTPKYCNVQNTEKNTVWLNQQGVFRHCRHYGVS